MTHVAATPDEDAIASLRELYASFGRPCPPDEELAAMLATESRSAPASEAPWYDLRAFEIEKDRLEAIPSNERTDAERDYLRFLKQVAATGIMRRRCEMPDPAAILALTARFPNFAQPLQFLAEQAAYARLRGEAECHFIPMLLAGPAGVGKTYFAMALADILGSRTEVLGMSSQSCGFALSGMDRGWSTARPGMIFESLRHGETLSPVIVLDEIDKANGDSRSDPLGPLYSLLEPRSSRAFRDEFAGFPIDASQVFWLATANDASRIPGPLLSRFQVFEVAEPSQSEVLAIAEGLFTDSLAGLVETPVPMPASWGRQLTGHSLREVRIAIQQALGRAALRAVSAGQSAVTVEDRDLQIDQGHGGRRIGF